MSSSTCKLYGKEWYYRLLPQEDGSGLLDAYLAQDLDDRLIICLGVWTRLFTVVDSVEELEDLIDRIPEEKRCLYEVIDGMRRQRPRFDIDAPRTVEDQFVPILLGALNSIDIAKQGRPLIFSSHDSHKISYHVVLNGVYHNNSSEARQFYERVMERIDEQYRPYFDHAVYSSRQQFRIMGCRKFNTNRVKIPVSGTPRLEDTLVSITKDDDLWIETVQKRVSPTTQRQVTSDEVERAMCLLEEHGHEPGVFQVANVQGGLVSLKRMRASFCPVCERLHDAENPYMVITNNYLYWYCRRNEKRQQIDFHRNIQL